MPEYLAHTRESFNKIAGDFDRQDRANEILQWMRGIVYEIYLENIKPGSSVLELNSGTGLDAVYLAGKGMRVFATDISDEMLSHLQMNAAKEIAEGKIEFQQADFSGIGQIDRSRFDAVISNFGGLNCINDFKQLSADLSAKLKTGGKFIAVVMNRICPWEILYYLLKLSPKKAFRRFKKEGIDGAIDDQFVKTFYFSPTRFADDFKEHFTIEKIYAHGLYTPSPYMLGIYKRIKPIVKIWMKIDELVKGIFPFNRFGDHFIIILKKSERIQ